MMAWSRFPRAVGVRAGASRAAHRSVDLPDEAGNGPACVRVAGARERLSEAESRLPPLKAPFPDLFTGTIAQVYPHHRGQNSAIGPGEELAPRLLQSARNRPLG